MMPSTKIAQKEVAIALDKKYLQIKSPEPLVQNQNNFSEMVLMLPSTKIDQKVQLGCTTWVPKLKIEISLNQLANTSSAHVPGLRLAIQGPRALLLLFFQKSMSLSKLHFRHKI